MNEARRYLFLVASTREPADAGGHQGNTERLARQAAGQLPADTAQQWLHLAHLNLPVFVDQRHTTGQYPMPDGDLKTLLDATLEATDIVFVAPVYWYSLPTPLKTYLDHWSAWMRIPGIQFKEQMAQKRLHLVSTSGDRSKAQPMIDSVKLCAEFLSMSFAGVLWGKGGPPDAVQSDTEALAAADQFFDRANAHTS